MRDYAAIILAAGMGTRMKSGLCKVLHEVAGRPMISYVIDALESCRLRKLVVVVGHQADTVRNMLQKPGIEFALQEPQLGTGHAVMAARGLFQDFAGDVLILCGDIPLIRTETLLEFMRFHQEKQSKVTVMTALLEDPTGYGRIIRDSDQAVNRIVEERDANDRERSTQEINTGIYLVNAAVLYKLLSRVGQENDQHEYYLTDIVAEAARDSIPVNGMLLRNAGEASGINSRSELARAASVLWEQRRSELMDSGVMLLDPSTVYVDAEVRIGPDTVIHPCVTLKGKSAIGRDCIIESGVYLMDSRLGDRVKILQGSRLDRAVVGDDTSVGPMAHLRPEARIGKSARIGNFVEVKKSTVGDRSKASHLPYLGDSTIGRDVNIGCGTITCNYDGKLKHPTVIRDRCFVGSDVQFVAPVEIGEGSVIGAGSTITRDVPPGMLAVSRATQKVYPLRPLGSSRRTTPQEESETEHEDTDRS